MSSDSLALFRKNASEDIRKLAEEHYKHDLNDSDRENLRSAGSKIGWHTTAGSVVGLGLGLFLAFRVRNSRTQMFNAFRATEKPMHVRFADGREGKLSPSLPPLLAVLLFPLEMETIYPACKIWVDL